MATPQAAPEPLLRFCGSLRELKFVSGAPSLGDLRHRMPSRPGASTLSELFAGKIRRAPRWELVRELVGACREYALTGGIDLPEEFGAVEAWRRRHEDLVRALDDAAAQRPAGELGRLLRLAPDNRPPCLGELSDGDLGVSQPLPGASAGYITRADFDEEMRSMLTLEGPPYPYVIAYGDEGAGKTRSAVEALRAVFPATTPVLIPRDRAALTELVSLADSLGQPREPVVVWMDDLTVADLEQLTPRLLEWLSGRTVTAGTISTHRCREIIEGADSNARAALRAANLVHLPLELGDAERAEAVWHFERGAVPRSFAEAADVAQPREMLLRLNTARSTNAVGVCVVRAAIDCYRAGLVRGLTRDELLRLLPSYLTSLSAAAATDAQFEQGLHWAQEPAVGGRALLGASVNKAGELRWRAASELVGAADTGPVPDFVWREVIDMATPEDCMGIGWQASSRDAQVYAAAAFTKATEHEEGRAHALLGLGQAKNLLGSRTFAKATFRSAAEAGNLAVRAEALVRLGDLLRQEGDLPGAEEAWRLAATTGDKFHAPMAFHQLGLMRVRQRDFSAETEDFFRKAAASGDPELAPRSWAMMATLREYHGDLPGALQAYDRAAEWDNPHVKEMLDERVPELGVRMAELAEVHGSGAGQEEDAEGLLRRADRLLELGDSTGALAAFRDAAEREDQDARARALFGMACVLAGEKRIGEACEALEAVAECNIPHRSAEALFELGVLLERKGEWAGAHCAWSKVVETGVPEKTERAAVNLGLLELRAPNHEAAMTAFLRAVAARDPNVRAKAALNLALLGADSGLDDDEVDDWYRIAVETGDPEFMPQAALALAGRLVDQGQRAEPRRLIEQAIESGDPESGVRGPMILGMIQECDGDVEGAAALYRKVIELGHPEHSVGTHVLLGRLALRTGRLDAARWHLRAALDARHPEHSPEAGGLLARMHVRDGDSDVAKQLLRRLMETGHPHVAPEAGELLADLLARDGLTEEARRLLEWVSEQGQEPWASGARARLAELDDNGG
ncbi:tetratricopeptide repeat protein [Streptomyces niveus]|uniref:tetratricopeptide repeat protein n=1 Tax=Streptomyces niveus TaxID=193462 RepID=UPI00364703B1